MQDHELYRRIFGIEAPWQVESPRSHCGDHGVRVVEMPWAKPSSRFTALLELLAIEWLKAASQKAVAGLRLSWDEIRGIMERAGSVDWNVAKGNR